MIFWALAALLTALVTLFLLHPLMKSGALLAHRWGWTLTILIPAIALGGYLWLGAFGRPDLPLDQNPRAASQPPPEAQQALNNLLEDIHQEPETLENWSLLAETYRKMGRFAESAEIWRHLSSMTPNPDFMAAWAETATLDNSGQIPADVLPILDQALTINHTHIMALHLRSLAYAQADNMDQAKAGWKKLLKILPADHPLRPQIEKFLTQASLQK